MPINLFIGASWQVWEKASSIAEAYKIGRSESTAAHNLLNNVDPAIVSWLTSLVQ